MGRKAALLENGFEEGTNKYHDLERKMIELESLLYKLKTQNMTLCRFNKVVFLLGEFVNNGMEFTIGKIRVRTLQEFIKVSYGVMSSEFIKSIINKFIILTEINPISYGYGNDEIAEIVQMIDTLKAKGGILCL